MRTKIVFQVVVFASIALAARCQDDQVTRVEFTSLSRGYLKQVLISRDSLVEVVNSSEAGNKAIRRKLSDGEWQELTKVMDAISVAEIAGLPSPTFKRSFDGARHSTIVIFVRDGKSPAHSFDDEDPNEKLRPLMDVIKRISASAGER